jgi:alpha-tubulin suppressor-like RCC1 family protein
MNLYSRSCLAVAIALGSQINPVIARADSSSPLLAAYYDRQMAIVDGNVYAWPWRARAKPKKFSYKAVQVGIGRHIFYVLTVRGLLIAFTDRAPRTAILMSGVRRFAAGAHGVMAIKHDGTLWWVDAKSGQKQVIAKDVRAAAVGDGAYYYITKRGDLYVRGLAHRGQYGNGQLEPAKSFIKTAGKVAWITAHTGHAIMLKFDGCVYGTGGNIYGPVGKHGLGDKAVRWSKILCEARAIATGASHSLAITNDGTLMAWGRDYGTTPVPILKDVQATAAGTNRSMALKQDGSLWQWQRGQKPRHFKVE